MEPLARRLLRRAAIGLSALSLFVAFAPGRAAQGNPPLEQAVQASFLFKFAPFVQWPPSAFGAGERDFLICVVGQDPFGAVLDDVVRGQKLAERAVRVKRAATAEEAGGCQILFAGHSDDPAYAPFATLAGQPVLTVSDQNGGPPGAMIQFVTRGGRVRFAIDDSSARASGLRISSKLLGLAVTVDRR